jgi:hypothetical protein
MEAGPKDTMKFDPHRTSHTSPAPQYTYIDIPLHGKMMVNSDTKQIIPIPGAPPLPAVPLQLPQALMDVAQPNVRTCGPPGEKNGAGCTCAQRGGCAIYNQFGRIGPKNLIIEKWGRVDSIPCHLYYVGLTASGRPAHGAGYSLDGWRVLTDRTAVERTSSSTVNGQKISTSFMQEVDNLPPYYDHLKKNGSEAPKKMGRPKGSKNKPKEIVGSSY